MSLVVVALLAGGAIGYFGASSNPAATHMVTLKVTVITSGTRSYTVVVFTVIEVQTVVYDAVCTTNSAGATTTYYQEEMGGPTSVTTEIPSALPSDFLVAVTTAQGYSVISQVYSTSQC